MATNPRYDKPPQGGLMTFENFKKLSQIYSNVKYEYIDGIAYLMAGGSVEHDRISRNTAHAIERQFGNGPCHVCGSDVQVLIGVREDGKKHYVFPDVTVSCNGTDRRRGNTLIESPKLVVEVLSPSTEAKDRGVKLKAYKAHPTVQEYLLISQFARHIEVYRRNPGNAATWTYSVYGEEDAVIELASLGLQITMDEVYQGIDFTESLEDE